MRLSLLIGCLIFSSQIFAQNFEKDIRDFSEGTVFKTNIYDIEALNIKKSMLPNDKKPWSGSYWANRAGSIGARYKTSNFSGNTRILFGTGAAQNRAERNLKELEAELNKMSDEELSELSPAEKYDLLVGDLNFTFTKQLSLKTIENKEHWGSTTFWTGICHGWAPASIHLPRPAKSLRLPVLNGTRTLLVFPDDVKAMGSFLWANKSNNGAQMFSGSRCNQKYPEIDSKTGEVKPLTNFARNANECADTDPLIMHLVTINRIALMKKSFVLDVDFDAPVNNHPLSGYELKFFNLNDFKKDGNLNETIIPLNSLKKDILANSRHPKATHVVGVEMTLYLAHWQNPIRSEFNSPADDKTLEETIYYQLDLDANGEPLKGHWRAARNPKSTGKPRFPDFIWNDFEGFRPSEYYTYISNGLQGNLTQGLNDQWAVAAYKNSSNRIKLTNETRLSHRLSKRDGLQDQAKDIMSIQQISKPQAADQLEQLLNAAGVPVDEANPQLLSKVVLELFELAK